MKVAVMAGLLAKGDMEIETAHTEEGGKYGLARAGTGNIPE
jgi:hypothetical protein